MINNKTALYLLFSISLFISFNAVADSNSTLEHKIDKLSNEIRILRSNAVTDSNSILEHKIDKLSNEIKILRNEVQGLYLLVEKLETNDFPSQKRWGCYINTTDSAYYGSGDTKAEAKGKTLYECKKQQRTGCFESSVECTAEQY